MLQLQTAANHKLRSIIFQVTIRILILIITIRAAALLLFFFLVLIIAISILYYMLNSQNAEHENLLRPQMTYFPGNLIVLFTASKFSFSIVSHPRAVQAPCTGTCSSCRRWCLLGNQSGQDAHGTYLEAHSQLAHTILACSISYQHR